MALLLQGIQFDNTLGALFVGFSVSAVLYGMFTIQVYSYYRQYPMDKVGYKAMVAFIWLTETIHQALVGHCVYYYAITNYMNFKVLLDKPVWSLPSQLIVGALAGTVVKFLFSMRVWRFSYGNWWLTGILLLLTFGQLGLAIAFTVKSFEIAALPELVNLRVLGSVSLGLGVLNDIFVTASLCYYLQTMRVSYDKSDSLIRTLTIYAVNAGVLTSVTSIVTLVIYDLLPENFIFVGCYFVLSKLYAISLITTLNTRRNVGGRGTDREQMHTTFQMVTEGQIRTLNIPMQAGTVMIPNEVEHYHDPEACQDLGSTISYASNTPLQSQAARLSRHSSVAVVQPVYAVGW